MSDHGSGPGAQADPSSDICDLYAFPSPERAGHLVLVMDLFPFAGLSAVFSDAVMCRFRLRPVTIAATGPAAAFDISDSEFTFDCTFKCRSSGTAARRRKADARRRPASQLLSRWTTRRAGAARVCVYSQDCGRIRSLWTG